MGAVRRLAIVVSTTPDAGDMERAEVLARAARASEVDVEMFFMDAAVAGLRDRRTQTRELQDLGCEMFACAASAQRFGVDEAGAGMLLGSQDDHAAIVHRAHRVVAFT